MQGVKIPHIRNLALAALSAILLSLSFPGYDMEVLAWLSLLPLFLIIKGGSARNAFLWCWTSGTLFFFIQINWVIKTMNNYGGIPLWGNSPLLFLFLPLFRPLLWRIRPPAQLSNYKAPPAPPVRGPHVVGIPG